MTGSKKRQTLSIEASELDPSLLQGDLQTDVNGPPSAGGQKSSSGTHEYNVLVPLNQLNNSLTKGATEVLHLNQRHTHIDDQPTPLPDGPKTSIEVLKSEEFTIKRKLPPFCKTRARTKCLPNKRLCSNQRAGLTDHLSPRSKILFGTKAVNTKRERTSQNCTQATKPNLAAHEWPCQLVDSPQTNKDE